MRRLVWSNTFRRALRRTLHLVVTAETRAHDEPVLRGTGVDVPKLESRLQ